MKKLVVIGVALMLLPVMINESKLTDKSPIHDTVAVSRADAVPVVVSKENPFYALIATPVALYYGDEGMQVQPLLVEDVNNPSSAVQRFKESYGLCSPYLIAGKDIVNASIELATAIWDATSEAIIIKNDFEGYSLGVALSPLASYMGIPIFVANDLSEILPTLQMLGVQSTYVCGDIDGYGTVISFEDVAHIHEYMRDFVKQKFGTVDYIVMTNPLDITEPEVLDSVEYHFEGELNSGSTLHGVNLLLHGFDYSASHEFEVPYEGFARIKVELINKDSDQVEQWGDRLFLHMATPDNITFIYTSTAGGIPEVDSSGNIVVDRLDYQTCVYNKPGVYDAEVVGTWIAKRKGSYELNIRVEQLDRGNFPLMRNLSSLAGYLASYHRGIVFAKPEFAFAGGNNADVPGIVYPLSNEFLVEPCNEHIMGIHEELNHMLASMRDLPDEVQTLREQYLNYPVYIALLADATMIPMYYYYNPDSDYVSGQGVASDFIYGDIDPDPEDMENDTLSYYPVQENIVGRVTGYDAEDCSAFLARTFFYRDIIAPLGDWKHTATVQTGTGIEFQKIPLITPLVNQLKPLLGFGPVRDEPTKFPTGESKFINERICHDFESNGYAVLSAHKLDAQRTGVIMERNGGQYQMDSNYIFAFDHGTHYLFEAGDALEFDQFGLGLKSGLSGKGSFDVRHVVNMPYNPSVAFIESCLVGKIEGMIPENCLSQAYIHAGVNSFVASTRYTADPGYLEPGLIFKGFGIYGYLNATRNLRRYGEYPDLHFGAVLAEDFILDIITNNVTVGMALRNAKNAYLPKDANSTFLWTPPLTSSGGDPTMKITWNWALSLEETRALDKKYVCIHEFTLYGDPGFNPYS